jgi:hypothetical protein
MKHVFDQKWYDRFVQLAREYKKQGDYYNMVWVLSNIKILYGHFPALQRDDQYDVIRTAILFRQQKEYFQLSFLLSRLALLDPDFFIGYHDGDRKEFERLLVDERLQKNWANVLRLCSRYQAFDRSLVTLQEEERQYIKEQLLEYKAEKLYWDFVMMQSFAYMVDPKLAVDITETEWKDIDKILQDYQEKDIWAYCRMLSWIAIIEK